MKKEPYNYDPSAGRDRWPLFAFPVINPEEPHPKDEKK
jgi:hypothetical protein